MVTDKPQISILMAIYEPRMDWLREQLLSLNAQTYPNLKLYIRNDCSPTVPLADICACVKECITAFPYEIVSNAENLGSNKTFELLTREAEGEYFAYCDQDDVWLPEKLTVMERTLSEENTKFVCSDMYIIDGSGKTVAQSITEIRRRHVFRSGTGLTDTLWYSNFASGCALLVQAEIAKAAIPFNPYMYYDHYITLFSANSGALSFIDRPLIQHREHGENQSSTMQGVFDRESYLKKRVDIVVDAVRWLTTHFPADETLQARLQEGLTWMEARQQYLRGDHKQGKILWKYRRFSPKVSLFELALPYLPDVLFQAALWAVKNNYI